MTDLRTLRICARAAVTAVTGIVTDYLAVFRPPLTPVAVLGTWPCGGVDKCYGTPEYAQPLGEYPDLPYVPGPNPGATVPGGIPPAAAGDHYRLCPFCLLPDGHSGRHVAQRTIPAAGDHSTSALLDLPASELLEELASKCDWLYSKAFRLDPNLQSNVIDDLITAGYERAEACRAVEAMTRPLGDMLTDAAVEVDQLAALGDPADLVPRTNLSDALIAAAALIDRAVPHPADLSGGASKREVDSPAKRDP